MPGDAKTIVKKLWNYCNILRDDGVSYSDYVEQLTYLLFLKMANGSSHNQQSSIPEHLNWQSLLSKNIDELENHYDLILKTLGKKKGTLGVIFKKAQNKIKDPAKLKRIIELINNEKWTGLDLDIKGEIYEGLLEKNAEDVKSGAGQYFTPRPLIKAIVEVMNPAPDIDICDPACGTGGFLLTAHDHIMNSYQLTDVQKYYLNSKALKGTDIVETVTRLSSMNLYLHGISGDAVVDTKDSLVSKPVKKYDMVLTNPPFGKKSSVTITSGNGKKSKDQLTYQRNDFWATTSNKQLNFLQHVKTMLKRDGRAAIVVPDNVLFESGAGETIRRRLLDQCDVHTMLRLPTGVFYAQGVNANVLFFNNRPASKKPQTEKLWIYDLRTNMHFTLKNNPIQRINLDDFITCYNRDDRHGRKPTERFKSFSYSELMARDKANLDITWLRDEKQTNYDTLADPKTIASNIIKSLRSALDGFDKIYHDLKGD
ncbi:MAG: SAM-dependent DNA methyltransferase [Chloroflexi bacterium]|jgi:type I restriction enzyme M protein|nr:SAM-dependent DNA methyltransferase [Chloroflexota bacterium]MBT7082177.1 SAM-dependent DNA methyltransferase [Chloroflexota bacterium]MBT7288982.1 SAM-dependent DNA methyltransferase [Chloroflexota bacterium]